MRHVPRPLVVVAGFALALTVAAPAQALFDGTLTANKCVAEKVKCVAKAKSCLLQCHEKALLHGTAVDPTCVTKCRDRFESDHSVSDRGCFAKREELGGCGASVGDAGTFAARIEAHVGEIMHGLVPGGTPANTCTAKKVVCVRKYNACVLHAVRKAAEAGTAIGGLDKCSHYLDGSSSSCVGKLEVRYCDPYYVGCTSTKPPCLTFEDQSALRIQDDAFVDDVITGLANGPHDMNTQRCSGDTSVTCSSAPGGLAGCSGGLGTCEFFFGAPQPAFTFLFGSGICTVHQWNGSVSGTFDQSSGASAGTASLVSRMYVGPLAERPCPVCAGDPFLNDGTAGGTCSGGARNGMPCDANGVSPEPSYGTTSLDCPPTPGSLIATSVLDFDQGNNGMLTKAVTASSPNCNGAPGKKCLCASCSLDSAVACASNADCAAASAGTCTNSAGEPRKPNACIDETTMPGDGHLCAPAGGGEGRCAEGPIVERCLVESFRSCTLDGDCPASNDHCVVRERECFLGYDGNLGDTVSARGDHGPARNGVAAATFGALACQAPTTSSAVNAIVGLPGPVRYELIGVAEDAGGPPCPTRASFVPTAKAPAVDVGWSGIAHDQKMVGQAKITVAATCTGTHPNCSCSYTGPIANPNAP